MCLDFQLRELLPPPPPAPPCPRVSGIPKHTLVQTQFKGKQPLRPWRSVCLWEGVRVIVHSFPALQRHFHSLESPPPHIRPLDGLAGSLHAHPSPCLPSTFVAWRRGHGSHVEPTSCTVWALQSLAYRALRGPRESACVGGKVFFPLRRSETFQKIL